MGSLILPSTISFCVSSAAYIQRCPALPCPVRGHRLGGGECLLSNEDHVDGTQVEIVEERQCCEAVICRVLAGIELRLSC